MHESVTVKAFDYLMMYLAPKHWQKTFESICRKPYFFIFVIIYDLLNEYSLTEVHVCTPSQHLLVLKMGIFHSLPFVPSFPSLSTTSLL